MLKKINKISLLVLAITLIFSSVCFAATTSSSDAKLEIVENNVCTINIQGTATFEKKIVSYDLDKKELDLQLKVTNTTEPVFAKPTEITFLMDNSLSMRQNEVSNGVTRMDAVISAAKKLATSLLAHENVKIGITSFSSKEGNEGTLEDATLKLRPTSVSTDVLAAIDAIGTSELGPRTDIDAGLQIAEQNFSDTCENKYLVVLSDGVPNLIVGRSTFKYSAETATVTKAKLEQLENNGVKFFTVMVEANPARVETSTGLTYKALAEEIFGTHEEPTVGNYYYITDSQIEKTITETVLEDMGEDKSAILTNLKIYDYFPQEIVDNFDFSYVANPSKGTISPSINLEDNSIVWTIPELGPQETATVTYKLKLKANINEEILNKILDTNTRVDITANELVTSDGSNILSSDVTPKVRVQKENLAPDPIPQTGSTSASVIIMIAILSITIILGIRVFKYKNIK